LKSLFMGQNKLIYIHPDTFIHNTNLEVLDLHGNNISLRDRGPFFHLTSLRALNIADCNLSNISKETFRKTVKLIRLDISNNKLTYIDDHLFDYLNSLKFLSLSRNLLKSVDFLLTMSETNLQEISLYVSNNKLDDLSNDVLKRMGYLKNLGIHDNPLSCRCWDKNLLFHVSLLCSEYSDKFETYMNNCLNKTRVSVTEIIPMETRTTEISISEIIDYEILEHQRTIISKNLSGFNVTNDYLNIVTDAPVLNESSETFSKTEMIIMIVASSLTLVMLVSIIGVCFCPKISKSKLSVTAECVTIPEEGNYQQGRQCEVCRVYQNYTPTCNHTVSRKNTKTSKKRELNFANESSLETYTYELILRDCHEKCCLCETYERDYKNSNNDSEQNGLMPSLVAHDELETDTRANRTHPSCTLVNNEDTLSECRSDTSECGRLMLKFPRHSCNHVISYVAYPSGSINVSGRNRYLLLDRPFFMQSSGTYRHPTLEPPQVSKRVDSLFDRQLPSSKRQTECDGVTSTTSLEPNTDRDHYEIN
jgi:hypothetical protein